MPRLNAILMAAVQATSVLAAVVGSHTNGESTSASESFKWIGEIVPGNGEVTLIGRDASVSVESKPNRFPETQLPGLTAPQAHLGKGARHQPRLRQRR